MKAEYKKDFHHSYLILHVEDWKDDTSYMWKMISENEIPGLLSCECKKIDREILLYYDVTSRISLKEKYQREKITVKDLIDILKEILKILQNMEEYLLPEESLCLKTEYMYMDPQGGNIKFCYIPEKRWETGDSIRKLIEEFLPKLDHEDKKGVLTVYEFYQCVVSEGVSLQKLEAILKGLEKNQRKLVEEDKSIQMKNRTEEELDREQLLDSFFEQEDEKEENMHGKITLCVIMLILYILAGWYLLKNHPVFLWIWAGTGSLVIMIVVFFIVWNRRRKKDKEGKEKDPFPCELQKNVALENAKWEENDNDPEEMECTCLLEKDEFPGWCFERANGEVIAVSDKRIQFIGHMKENTDIYLESRAVSRIHAKIRVDHHECYLSDLNSKNGTWINQSELEGNQEILLKDGDLIRFADEEFYFKKSYKI